MKGKEGLGRGKFVLLSVIAVILSFGAGAASKFVLKPAWTKKYSVKLTDDIGKVYKDFSYGSGEANKFDLYVPADSGKESYGLVVYLHAGGFTSGDKSGDAGTLSWLCSKGYVAAGINYTLKTEENDKSVYSQSIEIRDAMPKVIEEAEKLGYPISQMAVSGGSAGGALAMLYAYRDAKEAPVPVRLMFEMVGPSSYYRKDWGNYGLDQDTEECRKAAAGLFSAMLGSRISEDVIDTPEYDEIIKPISAFMWIDENSVPSLLCYGAHDTVQPYKGAEHLEKALRENGVDYQMFVGEHSGHGMQNDNKVMKEYMETVEEYLARYMPIK